MTLKYIDMELKPQTHSRVRNKEVFIMMIVIHFDFEECNTEMCQNFK